MTGELGKLHRWRGSRDRSARSGRLCVSLCGPRPRRRKSKRDVTCDVLDRLAATCATDRLADTRDLAILLLAFASGGRPRSEVARLLVEQLSDEKAEPLDPTDPNSPTLPCVSIQLGRTKTGDADDEGRVFLVGPRLRPFASGGCGRTSKRDRCAARLTPRGNREARPDAAVDQFGRLAVVLDGRVRSEGG